MKTAKIELVRLPLATLKPHPRNPRIHPEPGSPQWVSLKKSLEHSYFDPICLNRRNGMLVSGHLRTKVLIEAGYAEADCVVVDYDEQTHIARMIAANHGAGMDDQTSMDALLAELDDASFPMDLAGFFDEMAPKSNPPAEPEPPPASRKSQQYLNVGRHRIPLTDAEFAGLSARFEAYESERQTRAGFIAHLLNPTRPKKRKAKRAK